MASDRDGQLALFGGPALVKRSRRTTDEAVRALRKLHRLEPVDVGHVAMLRTVADLIDAEIGSPERSAWTAARLVAEWRALWGELAGRADSGFDEQLREFFSDDADAGAHPAA